MATVDCNKTYHTEEARKSDNLRTDRMQTSTQFRRTKRKKKGEPIPKTSSICIWSGRGMLGKGSHARDR